MSGLFTSGGQSIGTSTSASVLPMNIQDWSPLGWTGWISLQSKGPSRVFSNITIQKHQFLGALVFTILPAIACPPSYQLKISSCLKRVSRRPSKQLFPTWRLTRVTRVFSNVSGATNTPRPVKSDLWGWGPTWYF